jgi:hypothetical protein
VAGTICHSLWIIPIAQSLPGHADVPIQTHFQLGSPACPRYQACHERDCRNPNTRVAYHPKNSTCRSIKLLTKNMERKRSCRRSVFWIIGFLILPVGYWIWHGGSPYQDRYYSPNGRFYMQKYSNFTLSRLSAASVGGGSDMIDGFIRIFDSKDKLVHEEFHTFIRDIEPAWDTNSVFILGCDDPILVALPASPIDLTE